MRSLDGILMELQDAQWHSFDEIKRCILLPSDKLNEILCFLENLEFIDKNKEKLRITFLGLKFLCL